MKKVGKMKKIISLAMVLVLLCTFVMAGGSSEASADKPIRITLSDIDSSETVPGRADQAVAELVYERSGGRIVIDVFPGGQLGDEAENVENLRSGAVGITRINVANLETRGIDIPEYTLCGLPYLFRSREHAEKFFYSEQGKALSDKIAEVTNGEIYPLDGYTIASPRHFFFKTEVRNLAEAAGKKVRSESTPIKIDMMSAFGMSATPMGLNDVYSALQTGMIDGGEHNISNYKNYAFNEQCPYVLLTSHNFNSNIYLISGTVVNQLSEEDLALLNECFREIAEQASDNFEAEDDELMGELEAAGVTFIEPEDIEAWQDAAQTLYAKYGAGYEAFIDEVLSFDN